MEVVHETTSLSSTKDLDPWLIQNDVLKILSHAFFTCLIFVLK